MDIEEYREHDTVALLRDLKKTNFKRGDVGTVVYIHDNNTIEIEFSDKNGVTISIIPVNTKDLIRLRMDPVAI